jgi:hypothetical protein
MRHLGPLAAAFSLLTFALAACGEDHCASRTLAGPIEFLFREPALTHRTCPGSSHCGLAKFQ